MASKREAEVLGVEHEEYHHSPCETERKHMGRYEEGGEENTETQRPKLSVIVSIFFLGLGPVANISCGFLVITAILGFIGNDLGGLSEIGWMVTAWSIASAVTFSIGGSLSDIFGRRYMILFGQLMTLVGSIICAVAKTVGTFIAGETLMGFSVGFIVVYAAVPEILPKKYRSIGLAWLESAICLPWAAIAVLLGNLFALKATWRWAFYIAIIYSAISLIGTAIFYFSPPRPRHDDFRTRWEQVMQLDYVAIILFTGSLTSFLLGISWADSVGHPWKSVSVILPIILGFVGFVAAFVYDFTIRVKSEQHVMFPLSLLRRIRKCTVSLVVVFVSGLVYYSMASLLPQATGYIFTSNGIKTGVYLLPNGFGQLIPACIVPLFIHRTKHPKYYILVAIGVQTCSTALYAYAIDFHLYAWMAFQFFGQSCFSLLTLTTVLNSGLWVEPHELGVTVGLLGTFRSMGGSVGNTIFGTILRTKANDELPRRIAAAAAVYGYNGNLDQLTSAVAEAGLGAPQALMALHLSAPLQNACLLAFKRAYVVAFRTVFLSTIPFGVVAFIAAIFIKDASEMMNKKVSVELERDVLNRGHHSEETNI